MKKEQTIGLIREALTALGALAFAGFTGWESIVGLLILIISVIWAIIAHEGTSIIFSLVRKIISVTPAILVELGFVSADQAASLVAFLLPIVSMAWSYFEKDKPSINWNKLPIAMLFVGLSLLLLPSCGGIRVTPDGCILGSYTRGSQTYFAGPCIGHELDEDGKNQVDRFQVIWENGDGQTLRATYWVESNKPVQIEYLLESGIWLGWSAKSGVTIGPVPPEVEKALEGEPEPVVIETPVVRLE